MAAAALAAYCPRSMSVRNSTLLQHVGARPRRGVTICASPPVEGSGHANRWSQTGRGVDGNEKTKNKQDETPRDKKPDEPEVSALKISFLLRRDRGVGFGGGF